MGVNGSLRNTGYIKVTIYIHVWVHRFFRVPAVCGFKGKPRGENHSFLRRRGNKKRHTRLPSNAPRLLQQFSRWVGLICMHIYIYIQTTMSIHTPAHPPNPLTHTHTRVGPLQSPRPAPILVAARVFFPLGRQHLAGLARRACAADGSPHGKTLRSASS